MGGSVPPIGWGIAEEEGLEHLRTTPKVANPYDGTAPEAPSSRPFLSPRRSALVVLLVIVALVAVGLVLGGFL